MWNNAYFVSTWRAYLYIFLINIKYALYIIYNAYIISSPTYIYRERKFLIAIQISTRRMQND